MENVCGVLLAAGRSTRTNKLIAPIGGRPMVRYALQNLRNAGIGRILAVVGHERARVKEALGEEGVDGWVIQEEQLGSGHAAAQAIADVGSARTVVVLFGDCPFLDSEIIQRTIETHRDASATLTIATARLRDPRELGQIRRCQDGTLERVVDGRIEQNVMPTNAEVFAGLSVWQGEAFRDILPNLPYRSLPYGREERNLPDAIEYLVKDGGRVASYRDISEYDAIAPNDPVEFDAAGGYLRTKVRGRLLAQGVEIQDQQTVIVDYEVEVGSGTKIGRNVHLLGETVIGRSCEIGPDTTLRDCVVGDSCVIGRGSWSNQVFQAGVRASDRLAAEQRYFRRPHFIIPEEPTYCFAILPFHEPYLSLFAYAHPAGNGQQRGVGRRRRARYRPREQLGVEYDHDQSSRRPARPARELQPLGVYRPTHLHARRSLRRAPGYPLCERSERPRR